MWGLKFSTGIIGFTIILDGISRGLPSCGAPCYYTLILYKGGGMNGLGGAKYCCLCFPFSSVRFGTSERFIQRIFLYVNHFIIWTRLD